MTSWVAFAALTALLISLRDVVNKLGLRGADPLQTVAASISEVVT